MSPAVSLLPGTLEDGFLRASDGARLYFRERWLPDAPAHVVTLHGLTEHHGRYRYLEEGLARAGLGYSTFDLRGHGQTDGARGDVPSFETYLLDVDLLVERARARGRTVILFGHSLGALIALRYVQTRRPRLAGLITSGAPLAIPALLPRGILPRLAPIGRLPGGLPIPAWFTRPKLCRDLELVERYHADPLVGRVLSFRLAGELLPALQRAYDEAEQIDLPLLVLHGALDRLAPPAGSEALFRRARSTDKELVVEPGLLHELLNEPERDRVLARIVAWVRAHAVA